VAVGEHRRFAGMGLQPRGAAAWGRESGFVGSLVKQLGLG